VFPKANSLYTYYAKESDFQSRTEFPEGTYLILHRFSLSEQGTGWIFKAQVVAARRVVGKELWYMQKMIRGRVGRKKDSGRGSAGGSDIKEEAGGNRYERKISYLPHPLYPPLLTRTR
jgi:hypothetical protein